MSTQVTTGLQVRRSVELTVDGQKVTALEGSTLLDACRASGKEIPTLCYGDTITPKNACRVCMVELEGSRTLVPSCSRKVEAGMVVNTNNERTSHSRKLVLELAWLVRRSFADEKCRPMERRLRCTADRGLVRLHFITVTATMPSPVITTHQMAQQPRQCTKMSRVDNTLYVRDYSKCILCYQCVDACGEQWQNTFAITTAGRGFDARISTEFAVDLTDSACVYCGNCIQVCPTGALMFTSEYDMRQDGTWNEPEQTQTDTICPYCGVGCALTLHVQDNTIVKVTSPSDHSVTNGNLCIKGRFGFQHVQNHASD